VLVLFASTLLSKNVYQSIINPRASEATVMRLSRMLLLIITGLALVFAIFFPNELVNLLILGYDGVCQFFPGVVFGLFWKKVRKESILAGLVAGLGVVMILILSGHDPFWGLNAGFVGLIVNLAVTLLAVSLNSRWSGREALAEAN